MVRLFFYSKENQEEYDFRNCQKKKFYVLVTTFDTLLEIFLFSIPFYCSIETDGGGFKHSASWRPCSLLVIKSQVKSPMIIANKLDGPYIQGPTEIVQHFACRGSSQFHIDARALLDMWLIWFGLSLAGTFKIHIFRHITSPPASKIQSCLPFMVLPPLIINPYGQGSLVCTSYPFKGTVARDSFLRTRSLTIFSFCS